MDAPRSHAYDACNATVPALLFAGTVALSMLAAHPAFAALSLVGALAFSLLVRGAAVTARGLAWQLPMLALVCLANPLFSASGSTLLAKWGTLSVYAESLWYGATMGMVMVASVVWLEGAAQALTQDRLLALMGRRARALPLLVSMAAQLVPQLLARARAVRSTRAACTAAGAVPGVREDLLRTSNLLMAWALEDSLERADSLRARGWESGRPRTRYRIERLRRADGAAIAGLTVLLALSAAGAWSACSAWRFYPVMGPAAPWVCYVPFAVLVAVPSVAELVARARERGL